MEALLTLAITASVPVAIAYVAWSNRVTRPIAARLFIAAAICLFLQIGVGVYEQQSDANYVVVESDPDNLDLANTLGDELNRGSPGWQRMIGWQIALSGFDIAAWSLMAWAILLRPEIGSLTAKLEHS